MASCSYICRYIIAKCDSSMSVSSIPTVITINHYTGITTTILWPSSEYHFRFEAESVAAAKNLLCM